MAQSTRKDKTFSEDKTFYEADKESKTFEILIQVYDSDTGKFIGFKSSKHFVYGTYKSAMEQAKKSFKAPVLQELKVL